MRPTRRPYLTLHHTWSADYFPPSYLQVGRGRYRHLFTGGGVFSGGRGPPVVRPTMGLDGHAQHGGGGGGGAYEQAAPGGYGMETEGGHGAYGRNGPYGGGSGGAYSGYAPATHGGGYVAAQQPAHGGYGGFGGGHAHHGGGMQAQGGGRHGHGRIMSRYKTKLCSFYMDSNGSFCPHGPECQFAHGYGDLRLPGGAPAHPGYVAHASMGMGVGVAPPHTQMPAPPQGQQPQPQAQYLGTGFGAAPSAFGAAPARSLGGPQPGRDYAGRRQDAGLPAAGPGPAAAYRGDDYGYAGSGGGDEPYYGEQSHQTSLQFRQQQQQQQQQRNQYAASGSSGGSGGSEVIEVELRARGGGPNGHGGSGSGVAGSAPSRGPGPQQHQQQQLHTLSQAPQMAAGSVAGGRGYPQPYDYSSDSQVHHAYGGVGAAPAQQQGAPQAQHAPRPRHGTGHSPVNAPEPTSPGTSVHGYAPGPTSRGVSDYDGAGDDKPGAGGGGGSSSMPPALQLPSSAGLMLWPPAPAPAPGALLSAPGSGGSLLPGLNSLAASMAATVTEPAGGTGTAGGKKPSLALGAWAHASEDAGAPSTPHSHGASALLPAFITRDASLGNLAGATTAAAPSSRGSKDVAALLNATASLADTFGSLTLTPLGASGSR
jgi:hypothetical protein